MDRTELRFRLVLVTSRGASRLPLVEAARCAVAGGVDCIQLRDRDLPDRELHRLAEQIRKVTADAGAAMIVNHRVDVSLACGADGVHLGWRSMGVAKARQLVGASRWIGVSTHSPKEVRIAAEDGADYVTLGPVFHTPSKEELVPELGIDGLHRLCAKAELPVIAIGGIGPGRVREVLDAGAWGLAVIRAILDSDDPGEAASRLRAALDAAR